MVKMYVRKRFDIGWASLLAGVGYLVRSGRRADCERAVEEAFAGEGPALACLSVRSGFDVFLSSVGWAKGSEVIMTAVTIPAMGEIVAHYGFVAVGVDVDTRSVRPDIEAIAAAIGPKTRAIVVAHLFGTRVSLTELRALATRHDLVLIEDCAQSYDGRPGAIRSVADISMYSFGTIKTATAFGGAVLVVKDEALLQKMRDAQATYPVMGTRVFGVKLLKYIALILLSMPVPYGVLVRVLGAAGKDYDAFARNMVKGFSGARFFEAIRQQPSGAQLALLHRQLSSYNPQHVTARQACGHQLADMLSADLHFYGCGTKEHTYWLFALVVANPDVLISALREAGFDATSGSSTLAVIETDLADAPCIAEARYGMEHIVYLPLYPEMPARSLKQMAQVINDVAQAGVLPERAVPARRIVKTEVA